MVHWLVLGVPRMIANYKVYPEDCYVPVVGRSEQQLQCLSQSWKQRQERQRSSWQGLRTCCCWCWGTCTASHHHLGIHYHYIINIATLTWRHWTWKSRAWRNVGHTKEETESALEVAFNIFSIQEECGGRDKILKFQFSLSEIPAGWEELTQLVPSHLIGILICSPPTPGWKLPCQFPRA